MVIKNLEIFGLHGYYNYDIDLNSDITFMYGTNGCGKTTILNIISSIITGRLYNLFQCEFGRIDLLYSEIAESSGVNSIISVKRKRDVLSISLNSKSFEINLNELDERYMDVDERNFNSMAMYEFEQKFFRFYPIAHEIASIFNYVYLPLNRNTMQIYHENEVYGRMRNGYRSISAGFDSKYTNYLNESLSYIEGLIRENYANINMQENRINDQFRSEVLTSSVSVTANLEIDKLINELNTLSWKDILQKKRAYIKTLKDLGNWDNDLEEKIESFFAAFKESFDNYKRQDTNKVEVVRLDLIFKYAEFTKIRKIADLAKKIEERKEQIRYPNLEFLKIMNEFFSSSGNGKVMEISEGGKITFSQLNQNNKKQPLTLYNLSSGEKQLVIIFASLVFGLGGKKRGIYIIDEPEASLHLAWQSKFVESILTLNKHIQLIFATHSPEIIGRFPNKTVRLVRSEEI